MKVNVVSRDRGLEGQFAKTIAEGFRKHGIVTRSLADGDADVLNCDVLLFVGQPAGCRITVGRIERAGSSRPGVCAWMYEPLPPPEMSVEEVRSAARFSALRTGKRWLRPIMNIVSYPHDLVLALKSGRDLGPMGMRFTIDSASFVLRGTQFGWLDGFFVSTEQKRRQLQDWGIAAMFLPVGQQTEFGRDLGLDRDIDVLFIGSVKSRRRRIALERLSADLQSRGLVVVHPEGGVWGEDRTHLVNRAKILLHLHQYDWDTPWMRWCLASANGAVVASEPLLIPEPFRSGTDYLEARTEDLVEAIARLAADAPRRAEMLASCRSTIALHMTQAASLDRLARELQSIAAQRRTQ